MIDITDHAEGCILAVHAQPGAKRNAVIGVHGTALKVAVTAPADKGRANQAIIETLCDALRIKRSQVELLSGATSRSKRILFRGLKTHVLRSRLPQ